MPSYKLAQLAERDLEAIWDYSFVNWGVSKASSYLDDLLTTFELLAEHPEMSWLRTEFIPAVRIHQHAHHLIVYLQDETDIHIVRVLHESMNISDHI